MHGHVRPCARVRTGLADSSKPDQAGGCCTAVVQRAREQRLGDAVRVGRQVQLRMVVNSPRPGYNRVSSAGDSSEARLCTNLPDHAAPHSGSSSFHVHNQMFGRTHALGERHRVGAGYRLPQCWCGDPIGREQDGEAEHVDPGSGARPGWRGSGQRRRGRHRDQRPAGVMAGAEQLDPFPVWSPDQDMVVATFIFEEVRLRQ
jgi:hypothetical protein